MVLVDLTPTDLEFRYLNSKSVGVNCDFMVLVSLNSTDLEFRYLNSKSVGVNGDLTPKSIVFNCQTMNLHGFGGFNPNGFGVQIPELQIRWG